MSRARFTVMSTAVAVSIATLVLVARPGVAAPVGGVATPVAASSSSATRTVTVSRDNLDDGVDHVVDTRSVTVNVDRTSDLRSNEDVEVTWKGAHPTGGIVADVNGDDGALQEYPMVLLECRGTDSTSVPVADRLSPDSCWTATPRERYQDSYNSAFPPWRVDRYAASPDRDAIVGAPASRPATCFGGAYAEHWVPFVAASGRVYPGGAGGCAGTAPEASAVGGLNMPSNTTYGITRADGTGAARFDVWTSADNASLGCSAQVACSLVAVPVMGISCDVDAAGVPADDRPLPGSETDDARSACEQTGAFAPGQSLPANQTGQLAVSGLLWWSASNWRNRIVVPLTFAPSSAVCSVVAKGTGVQVYGSELLADATEQWAPHFCLDSKLFSFQHVQSSEPEARSLLQSGGIEAAFSSAVPDDGFTKPVVSAPAALTGFAVTFTVDDSKGNPVTHLDLDARLLAKLLTESYPAIGQVRDEYAALAHNPLNITDDPEFQALNPAVGGRDNQSVSASTILSIATNSDVVAALTAYIDADPEARAWLHGTPDPWGMRVNPNYKGVALPTTSWPLLDTFKPSFTATTNQCLYDNPVPYLPLVAAPQSSLADNALDMQFSLAQSTTVCYQVADGVTEGEKLIALGRQQPGYRFMLGITTLADADRHGLLTAALESQSRVPANQAIVSGSGRTFVAPSPASLRAAAARLRPNLTTGTWPIPYQDLRQNPAGAGAYPGAMLVYAQVSTSGLPKLDASRYATLLRFIAGPGQVPGTGNGQLPDGYLPLNASNHLGAEAAYTLAAADAVAAQTGQVPPLVAPPSRSSTPLASPTGAVSSGATAGADLPTGDDSAGTAASTSIVRGPASGADRDATSTNPLGRTLAAIAAWLARVAAELLVLAVVAAALAAAVHLLGSRAGASAVDASDGADHSEEAGVGPAPVTRPKWSGARSITVGALVTLSGIALWCVGFGLVLSPMQEHRAQAELRAQLRGSLAAQTSPIGGHIAPGTPIGSLDAPSIGMRHVVFVEGTSPSDLEAGPGHRPDTPLPGQPGIAVLQGRSSLFGAPFARVDDLRAGAAVTVTTGQGTFVYRVTGQRRVGDRQPVPPQQGQGRLTLVTAVRPRAGVDAGDVQPVYVDATLTGSPQEAPAGRPVSIGAAQVPMSGDGAALPDLVFWLAALAAGGLLVGWLAARWRRVPALVLAAPALLALLWGATEAATRLFPNLW